MLSLPSTLSEIRVSLFLFLGAYADSLDLELLVLFLFVLPTSHRSPEITDVCWGQTQVPKAYVAVTTPTEPSPQPCIALSPVI